MGELFADGIELVDPIFHGTLNGAHDAAAAAGPDLLAVGILEGARLALAAKKPYSRDGGEGLRDEASNGDGILRHEAVGEEHGQGGDKGHPGERSKELSIARLEGRPATGASHAGDVWVVTIAVFIS